MPRGPLWTPSDDAALKSAAAQGATAAMIARTLNRTQDAVRARASRNKVKIHLGVAPGGWKRYPSRPMSAEAAAERMAVGGVRPAEAAPDPEPLSLPADLQAIEAMGPVEAKRALTFVVKTAPKVSDRVAALRVLLTWRKQEPTAGLDGDAVPAELLALWAQPHTRAILKRILKSQGDAKA